MTRADDSDVRRFDEQQLERFRKNEPGRRQRATRAK